MNTKRSISQMQNEPKTYSEMLVKKLREGSFILLLTMAFFILLSLLTYKATDPGFSRSSVSLDIANATGKVGAYISDTLYLIFGYIAYLIPLYLVYLATLVIRDFENLKIKNKTIFTFKVLGIAFIVFGGCGLLSLNWQNVSADVEMPGGVIGYFFAYTFNEAFNLKGALLLLGAMFLIGVSWVTGFSWIQIVETIGWAVSSVFEIIAKGLYKTYDNIKTLFVRSDEDTIDKKIKKTNTKKQVKVEVKKPEPANVAALTKIEPVTVIEESFPIEIQANNEFIMSDELPEIHLLEPPAKDRGQGGYTHQELENLSREVEQNLLDFGIQADVVAVHPGPVITRFELQLAAGVKANKLTALSTDLARSLSVTSVRVVEIIPGKTVVGIELPNQHRELVRLSEVLASDVYQNATQPLTLALGVDIQGKPMIVDLAKMPHLLVAGTTGSGKSVGINAMILSILFKSSPKEVRLIMIDPKMLELSVYEGIPHLLAPVVTDMKEAQSALRWCVQEMERRYRLMASLGVRNVVGFNNKIKDAIDRGEPILDPLFTPDSLNTEAPQLEPLPYIVVIIDELADMMMVVGKKVEQLIARIAQKARAAGIHLILATQRPSVDVLTGLIKSNIPTRISFQVSSKIDSRTILDQQGAEQLLGHGDMLFLAPGTGTPLRVHGAFVDDKEVHNVASDLRKRGIPQYISDITENTIDPFESPQEDKQAVEDSDPLYDQVVEFVIETRKTSISAIQRRFKIGYNRSARLVEEMERKGILGPLDGGVREVLVTGVTNYGE